MLRRGIATYYISSQYFPCKNASNFQSRLLFTDEANVLFIQNSDVGVVDNSFLVITDVVLNGYSTHPDESIDVKNYFTTSLSQLLKISMVYNPVLTTEKNICLLFHLLFQLFNFECRTKTKTAQLENTQTGSQQWAISQFSISCLWSVKFCQWCKVGVMNTCSCNYSISLNFKNKFTKRNCLCLAKNNFSLVLKCNIEYNYPMILKARGGNSLQNWHLK